MIITQISKDIHPSGLHAELTQAEFDAGLTVAFYPGERMSGVVSLSDGSVYDVTPVCIAVRPEHQRELALAIHANYHKAGIFTDIPLPSE